VVLLRTFLLWVATVAAFGGGREITVVTLNMAKETSAAKISVELRSIPALRDADVYLLQEVARGTAAPVAAALGLKAAQAPEGPEIRDLELAILSRYPLREVRVRALGRYDLMFHTRVRYALSATVETPWGRVRIVDTHLDTRLNAADRLAQLEGALAEAAGGPAVIGGDFNSNPFFWIGHVMPLVGMPTQASRVEAYMRGRGFQSAIPRSATTFDYLGMHLDWVWVRGMRGLGWQVFPLKFSDHHACWTRLEL
jgi:endonuclease/exonuclease/phosphatase family metal-dependent hydrolase